MTSTQSLKELVNLINMDNGMTEKQANILIAAIELFSEKGYQATTTSEIAKRAQVAEGTIFNYYKTKKDLLFAIPSALSRASFNEIFFDDFNEILNDNHNSFEKFLRKITINRKNFVSETAPILKVIIQEIPFHPELRIKILNTIVFPSVKKFILIIDKFKEKGQIIDMPSTSIVSIIAASIFGYIFIHYIALPELGDSEKDLDYLIQYIINAVCQNTPS